jgi:6,7-dimethyl-8-ribityllumazine synthase
MSREAPATSPGPEVRGCRIAIIAARFNAAIVDELLAGCVQRLDELGIKRKNVKVHRVPGAFELPLAAQCAARTERFSAVICLGAVVRGETPHFDYVAGECARGVAEVARAENLPVIFGVLTTNTQRQARERCGGKHGHAGRRAAEAALEMVQVLGQIDGRD